MLYRGEVRHLKMQKRVLEVQCFFTKDGDSLQEILLQSLRGFVERSFLNRVVC